MINQSKFPMDAGLCKTVARSRKSYVAARVHEEIDAVQQTTKLAELRAEGTIAKDIRLSWHASYNRSAGFAAADGYWYRTVGVTVIVPF